MMKLSNRQFEALTYIFERENGNTKTKFEEQIIKDSGIGDLDSTTLEKIVIDGLNNKIYKDSNERINAYWSLGKRHNKEIIPNFREWLSDEIKLKDAQAVYQILISLGNMEEDVFNPDRDGSSAFYETELNLRDAIDYLKNYA